MEMACRDVHATTLFTVFCGVLSIAGLVAATLLPHWRQMKLYTVNKNEKNLTVYIGLWVKCVTRDGDTGCTVYDEYWYTSTDQLDLRFLQLALPVSIVIAVSSLILTLVGICNTVFISEPPNASLVKCAVNSAGCHLVAGMLYMLASVISITPSIWVIFYNVHLNAKYEPIFFLDVAVYVAITSAGGLLLASSLLFLWYCACKALPSPFWQPLYSQPASMYNYSAPPYSTRARSRQSTIEIDIPVIAPVSEVADVYM
ncbi:claudin-12 [Protopterus annectens]|uniref:claudin-12 n=1 Tax=Protopterus annectens TaxID=7888 RepID=UPI001CFC30D8|nr:claudin-12 [Protopterus annectens]